MTTVIRAARVDDVDAMLEVINGYAREDRMLERTRGFLVEKLGDFLVAEHDGRFAGCCALAPLTRALAEVRSLAVVPGASGKGIGRELVAACVQRARSLGLKRVFALTLVPDFFTRCGFTLTSLGHLPEKSASECPVCPKRFACDEHAMVLHLDGSRPVPLGPSEPVGYTRLFLGREPS